jgi:hypothetical protein
MCRHQQQAISAADRLPDLRRKMAVYAASTGCSGFCGGAFFRKYKQIQKPKN